MIQDIAPHYLKNQYRNLKEIQENDYIFCYLENSFLLKKINGEYFIPQKKDFKTGVKEEDGIFLFSLDSYSCFLLPPPVDEKNECFIYEDIFNLRNLPAKEVAWAGGVGHQLSAWFEQNRYCGKCGSKTIHKSDERAIQCPECSHLIFPKISPAVIVAITCGDKILLAKGRHYRGNFFSLIAGYADIGESLEETVVREVKEEVGLEIKNIKYFESQPWPFSGSIMVGYFAEADENQPLILDPSEIIEANWYTRGNLPPYSSRISISGDMIEHFDKNL